MCWSCNTNFSSVVVLAAAGALVAFTSVVVVFFSSVVDLAAVLEAAGAVSLGY